MNDRVLSALKGLGIEGAPVAALEREGAFFALLEGTLVYQDEQGTRRVTLRDLTRIHSDQAGLLRVETPAGTALTASLLGFDPGRVQGFFAQVRDATARAKNLPASPLPTPGGPKTFGSGSKPTLTPNPASLSGGSGSAAIPAREDLPASQATLAQTPALAQTPTPTPQPAPTPRREGPVREIRAVTVPLPPVTLPAVGSKLERSPASAPPPTSPVPASRAAAVGTKSPLAELSERAGAVGALVSRLQVLAVVLGLAAVGLAAFQFLEGALLNGMWTLIAGGVSCIALLAFAEVTRLIVSLARAVAGGSGAEAGGTEGGGTGADEPSP